MEKWNACILILGGFGMACDPLLFPFQYEISDLGIIGATSRFCGIAIPSSARLRLHHSYCQGRDRTAAFTYPCQDLVSDLGNLYTTHGKLSPTPPERVMPTSKPSPSPHRTVRVRTNFCSWLGLTDNAQGALLCAWIFSRHARAKETSLESGKIPPIANEGCGG